MLNNILTLKSG